MLQEKGVIFMKSLICYAYKKQALALVLFAALFGSVAAASTSQTQSAPIPSITVHSSQAARIRTLAAGALAKVAHIRAQVRHGKNDHLRRDLEQLNMLVELIKSARSTGEIDALMDFYQQHLSFEDNKQVLADILPLYSALAALPHSKQTEAARQQLDRIRSALQNGKRAQALAALGNMRRTLSMDETDFPLQAADEKLRAITDLYEESHKVPQSQDLMGLENDLLQMIGSLQ